MKTVSLILLATLLSTKDLLAQQSVKTEVNTNYLELPGIEVFPMIDTQTKRPYELYLKLPKDYSKNTKTTYPVLYFTDAMWHIEILSGSTEYLLDNLILVGISWEKGENPQISRFRDYTILKGMHPKHHSGEAHNHLAFIQNDVIRFIENNYRTAPDTRSYFGYSLGATFGTYILLTAPETFNNYILGSPETLLDDSYIHENDSIPIKNVKNLKANIFISTGELERQDLIAQSKDLFNLLEERSNQNLLLEYSTIEGADHGKAFPMTTVKSMYWLTEIIKAK